MALSYIEGPYLNLLRGDITEIFQDFERRFDAYCIQSGFRDVNKDPVTERVLYYKEPLLEIAALKASVPDQELKIIEKNINENNSRRDLSKPWVWMEKLKEYFTEQCDEDTDNSSSSEDSNTKTKPAPNAALETDKSEIISSKREEPYYERRRSYIERSRHNSSSSSCSSSSNKREEPYFERRRSYIERSRNNSTSSSCSTSSNNSNDFPFRGESKWSGRGSGEGRSHTRVEGQRVQNIKAEFASRIEQQQSKSELSFKTKESKESLVTKMKEKESAFVNKVREDKKGSFVTQMEEKAEPTWRRLYYGSKWETSRRETSTMGEIQSSSDEDRQVDKNKTSIGELMTASLLAAASKTLNAAHEDEEQRQERSVQNKAKKTKEESDDAPPVVDAESENVSCNDVTEELIKHTSLTHPDEDDANSKESPGSRKLRIDDIMDGVQIKFSELAKLRKDSNISDSEESKYMTLLHHHKQRETAVVNAKTKAPPDDCSRPDETKCIPSDVKMSGAGNDKASPTDSSFYSEYEALYSEYTSTSSDNDTALSDNIATTLVTDNPVYEVLDSHEASSQMNNVSTNAHEDKEEIEGRNARSRSSRRSHEEILEMKTHNLSKTTGNTQNESEDSTQTHANKVALLLAESTSPPADASTEVVADKVYAKAILCLNDIINDVGRAIEEQDDEYECEELREAVGRDLEHAHTDITDMIDKLERTISQQTKLGLDSRENSDGEMDMEHGKLSTTLDVNKGHGNLLVESYGESDDKTEDADCKDIRNNVHGSEGDTSGSDEDEESTWQTTSKGSFDLSKYIGSNDGNDSSDEEGSDLDQDDISENKGFDLSIYIADDSCATGDEEDDTAKDNREETLGWCKYSAIDENGDRAESEKEYIGEGSISTNGVRDDHDDVRNEEKDQSGTDKGLSDIADQGVFNESFDLNKYVITDEDNDDSSNEESPRNYSNNESFDVNKYLISEEKDSSVDEKGEPRGQSIPCNNKQSFNMSNYITEDEFTQQSEMSDQVTLEEQKTFGEISDKSKNDLINDSNNRDEITDIENTNHAVGIEEQNATALNEKESESDFTRTEISIELIERETETETIKTEIGIDLIDDDKEIDVVEEEVVIEIIERERDTELENSLIAGDAEFKQDVTENEIIVEIIEEEVENDTSDLESQKQLAEEIKTSNHGVQTETIDGDFGDFDKEFTNEIFNEKTEVDDKKEGICNRVENETETDTEVYGIEIEASMIERQVETTNQDMKTETDNREIENDFSRNELRIETIEDTKTTDTLISMKAESEINKMIVKKRMSDQEIASDHADLRLDDDKLQQENHANVIIEEVEYRNDYELHSEITACNIPEEVDPEDGVEEEKPTIESELEIKNTDKDGKADRIEDLGLEITETSDTDVKNPNTEISNDAGESHMIEVSDIGRDQANEEYINEKDHAMEPAEQYTLCGFEAIEETRYGKTRDQDLNKKEVENDFIDHGSERNTASMTEIEAEKEIHLSKLKQETKFSDDDRNDDDIFGGSDTGTNQIRAKHTNELQFESESTDQIDGNAFENEAEAEVSQGNDGIVNEGNNTTEMNNPGSENDLMEEGETETVQPSERDTMEKEPENYVSDQTNEIDMSQEPDTKPDRTTDGHINKKDFGSEIIGPESENATIDDSGVESGQRGDIDIVEKELRTEMTEQDGENGMLVELETENDQTRTEHISERKFEIEITDQIGDNYFVEEEEEEGISETSLRNVKDFNEDDITTDFINRESEDDWIVESKTETVQTNEKDVIELESVTDVSDQDHENDILGESDTVRTSDRNINDKEFEIEIIDSEGKHATVEDSEIDPGLLGGIDIVENELRTKVTQQVVENGIMDQPTSESGQTSEKHINETKLENEITDQLDESSLARKEENEPETVQGNQGIVDKVIRATEINNPDNEDDLMEEGDDETAQTSERDTMEKEPGNDVSDHSNGDYTLEESDSKPDWTSDGHINEKEFENETIDCERKHARVADFEIKPGGIDISEKELRSKVTEKDVGNGMLEQPNPETRQTSIENINELKFKNEITDQFGVSCLEENDENEYEIGQGNKGNGKEDETGPESENAGEGSGVEPGQGGEMDIAEKEQRTEMAEQDGANGMLEKLEIENDQTRKGHIRERKFEIEIVDQIGENYFVEEDDVVSKTGQENERDFNEDETTTNFTNRESEYDLLVEGETETVQTSGKDVIELEPATDVSDQDNENDMSGESDIKTVRTSGENINEKEFEIETIDCERKHARVADFEIKPGGIDIGEKELRSKVTEKDVGNGMLEQPNPETRQTNIENINELKFENEITDQFGVSCLEENDENGYEIGQGNKGNCKENETTTDFSNGEGDGNMIKEVEAKIVEKNEKDASEEEYVTYVSNQDKENDMFGEPDTKPDQTSDGHINEQEFESEITGPESEDATVEDSGVKPGQGGEIDIVEKELRTEMTKQDGMLEKLETENDQTITEHIGERKFEIETTNQYGETQLASEHEDEFETGHKIERNVDKDDNTTEFKNRESKVDMVEYGETKTGEKPGKKEADYEQGNSGQDSEHEHDELREPNDKTGQTSDENVIKSKYESEIMDQIDENYKKAKDDKFEVSQTNEDSLNEDETKAKFNGRDSKYDMEEWRTGKIETGEVSGKDAVEKEFEDDDSAPDNKENMLEESYDETVQKSDEQINKNELEIEINDHDSENTAVKDPEIKTAQKCETDVTKEQFRNEIADQSTENDFSGEHFTETGQSIDKHVNKREPESNILDKVDKNSLAKEIEAEVGQPNEDNFNEDDSKTKIDNQDREDDMPEEEKTETGQQCEKDAVEKEFEKDTSDQEKEQENRKTEKPSTETGEATKEPMNERGFENKLSCHNNMIRECEAQGEENEHENEVTDLDIDNDITRTGGVMSVLTSETEVTGNELGTDITNQDSKNDMLRECDNETEQENKEYSQERELDGNFTDPNDENDMIGKDDDEIVHTNKISVKQNEPEMKITDQNYENDKMKEGEVDAVQAGENQINEKDSDTETVSEDPSSNMVSRELCRRTSEEKLALNIINNTDAGIIENALGLLTNNQVSELHTDEAEQFQIETEDQDKEMINIENESNTIVDQRGDANTVEKTAKNDLTHANESTNSLGCVDIINQSSECNAKLNNLGTSSNYEPGENQISVQGRKYSVEEKEFEAAVTGQGSKTHINFDEFESDIDNKGSESVGEMEAEIVDQEYRNEKDEHCDHGQGREIDQKYESGYTEKDENEALDTESKHGPNEIDFISEERKTISIDEIIEPRIIRESTEIGSFDQTVNVEDEVHSGCVIQGFQDGLIEADLGDQFDDLDLEAIEIDAMMRQISSRPTDHEGETKLNSDVSVNHDEERSILAVITEINENEAENSHGEIIDKKLSTTVASRQLVDRNTMPGDMSNVDVLPMDNVDDLIINAPIKKVKESVLDEDCTTKEVVSNNVFEENDNERMEINHRFPEDTSDDDVRKSSDSEGTDSDSDITITVTKTKSDSQSKTTTELTIVEVSATSPNNVKNTTLDSLSSPTDECTTIAIDSTKRSLDDSKISVDSASTLIGSNHSEHENNTKNSITENILQIAAERIGSNNSNNNNMNFSFKMPTRQNIIRTGNDATPKESDPTKTDFISDVAKIGRQLQLGGSEIIDEVREDVNTQYYAFNFDYIHGVKRR